MWSLVADSISYALTYVAENDYTKELAAMPGMPEAQSPG